MFEQVRQYLDTDNQNLADSLLDLMLRRIWFQAVNMEQEWRFLNHTFVITAPAGQALLSMDLIDKDNPTSPPVPAVRIDYLRAVETGQVLTWVAPHQGLADWGDNEGNIFAWTEMTADQQRQLRWFYVPASDTDLEVAFYAAAVYPAAYTDTFADLPVEFDEAFRSGLLAEAYMREEDPELYDAQRAMFLEQMGSIRNRWRTSTTDPLAFASEVDYGRDRYPARYRLHRAF